MSIFSTYGPRIEPFAVRPIEDDAFISILDGSVRSGKTTAMHPKILYSCVSPVAGFRILTGVSKATIYNNILMDLFRLIGPNSYHYNNQSGQLRLFNSPWMVVGAKDEGSEKYIRGSTIGIAVCDEITEMPEAFFKMLLTRLSPQGARFYGTTNPDNPLHWLNVDYLQNKKLIEQGTLYHLHCTMDDNPSLTEEFKNMQKSLYKGTFYDRFIRGLWVMASGGIYRDCWSDDLLYDDATRPKSLYNPGGFVDKWVAVDCGVDHPQVYGMFYDDGNVVWMDKEYWWDSRVEQRQKTDAQYADDLMDFMGRNDACQIVLPPECASFEAELVMRGLWVTQAENEVKEGIQTVSSMMASKKIRIHKNNCMNTIRDLQNHAWDPKAAKRGVEQPIKQNDDGADMFRYSLRTKIPQYRYFGQGTDQEKALAAAD